MAYIFELAAECGPDRQQAEMFETFFRNFSFELITGKVSVCYTEISQDQELNWWVEVVPSSITPGGIASSLEDAIDFSESGFRLYTQLLSAPPFRFALVDVEISMFISYSALLNIDTQKPFPLTYDGFVLDERIWKELGQPKSFSSFGNSHKWRQYRGHRYSPLEGNHEYAKKLRRLRDTLDNKNKKL